MAFIKNKKKERQKKNFHVTHKVAGPGRRAPFAVLSAEASVITITISPPPHYLQRIRRIQAHSNEMVVNFPVGAL